MKHIDLGSYPRKDIYLAFRDREMPHLSVTADVDITHFKALVDKTSCGFFLPMAYLAIVAANRIPAFRQRIVNGELVEFEECLPSFTVSVEKGLFSFDGEFLYGVVYSIIQGQNGNSLLNGA